MRRASKIFYQAVMLLIFAAGSTLYTGCSESGAQEPTPRADLVHISNTQVFGKLTRPPVNYAHDLHSAAVKKQGGDCFTCHEKNKDGKMIDLFKRSGEVGEQELMTIYHDNCIGCHQEYKDKNIKSGPVTCGDCHRKDPQYVSSWTEIGFDKSLHYRHVVANIEDCGRCHHVYDEAEKKLKYVKGQEGSCRDCHKSKKVDNSPKLSVAAHLVCVECHRTTPNAGPTECAGCHDKAEQAKIVVAENPQRLKRGQPDFVLLASGESERVNAKMRSVPFPHLEHENALSTCRVCHHESMKACMDCHTLPGIAEGNQVTLQKAMHQQSSSHSCVGCHDKEKFTPECAGCHSLMEQGRLTEHACEVCHIGPKPDQLDKMAKRYKSIKDFKPSKSEYALSFKPDDIPEKVEVGILSNKYEPAQMPHLKIIDKLRKNIAGSSIATHFHGSEDILCQGCHHHSPVGQKPPLCESCHGQPFDKENMNKPGLYGAYHRQCLGCHEAMGLDKAIGCEDCHKKKGMSSEDI